MKKIIAAAVATAFVAPAFAADVSLGGHMEFIYKDTTGSNAVFDTNETEINIVASEELTNGYSITAKINVIDDNGEDETTTAGNEESLDMQGSTLTLAGPMGSLSIGDASSALDNVGDYTDVSPTGGAFVGDGNDHAALYVLPTFIEGLKVSASFSPSGSNDMGAGTGVDDDAESLSAAYNFGAGEVYYGTESNATDELEAFGAKYTIAGLTIAGESAEEKTSGTEYEINGLSASYKYGDINFTWESQQRKEKNNSTETYTQKEVVMAAEYNWGSNVDVFVAVIDVDDTQSANLSSSFGSTADSTRVGIEYSF